MTASVVSFGAPLPPPEGRAVKILIAPSDGILMMPSTASVITGVDLHWDRLAGSSGRTCPHFEPAQTCAGCARDLPRRWRAYLPAWFDQVGRQVLLELTPEAVRNCPDARDLGRVDLRGRLISLSRKGRHKWGMVQVQVGDLVTGWQDLPPPVDVRAALLRWWGLGAMTLLPESAPTDRVD